MLTDITLGQYFPGNSYLHRLDPRMKIMGTMIFIFSVFLANEPLSYAVLAAFIAFTYALSRLSVQTMVKSLKPLWGIIIFTFAVHDDNCYAVYSYLVGRNRSNYEGANGTRSQLYKR